MPRVSINLDRELYERLEAAVGRSEIAEFIEEAVAERLDDWDYNDTESALDDASDADFEEADADEGESE